MSKDNGPSPRVNAQIMGKFVGKIVRLPCKVKNFGNNSDTAVVTASDGGEVVIQLAGSSLTDPDVEIIGMVQDTATLKALNVTPMTTDGEVDYSIIDQTIQLIHDPRFYSKIFS